MLENPQVRSGKIFNRILINTFINNIINGVIYLLYLIIGGEGHTCGKNLTQLDTCSA